MSELNSSGKSADDEESLDALKVKLGEAEERARAALDAIPPLPEGVGDGGAETLILILLELRVLNGDSSSRRLIQVMEERRQAQAAYEAGPQTEYSVLFRKVRRIERESEDSKRRRFNEASAKFAPRPSAPPEPPSGSLSADDSASIAP